MYKFISRMALPGLGRLCGSLAGLALAAGLTSPAMAVINLADQPLFSAASVPGNLLLPLSVEYPTALSTAYPNNSNPYTPAVEFVGYFDPNKCYQYSYNSTTPSSSYFQPYGAASTHACTSTASVPLWSGNFLNWASMQTIDSFRWAMTGGYRSVDTSTTTILERAWASGQGGNGETPNKSLPGTVSNVLRPTSDISGATPFTWSTLTARIWGLGNRIWISGTSNPDSVNANVTYVAQGSLVTNPNPVYTPVNQCVGKNCIATNSLLGNGQIGTGIGCSSNSNSNCTFTNGTTSTLFNTSPITALTGNIAICSGSNNSNSRICVVATDVTYDDNDPAPVYELYARVKVCDSTVSLENNCTKYGSASPYSYKPEGLMQQYAMKIRYGALGYLNDSAATRDGGVLRSKMKYVGPMQPSPGQPDVTNSLAEWSSTDGTYYANPNSADATASGVTASGVMNYLNAFGESSHTYKTYDPVSELYYAAIRYYKNQGNVTTYSDLSAGDAPTQATWKDGFPVITTWDDPILYACQKNFILGIGDVNTHFDRNLPGASNQSGNDTPAPAQVTADTTVNVDTATNMVGKLEGTGNLGPANWSDNASYYIAGLAYDSHTKDIRPNDFKNSDGTKSFIQTVSTYWLDVQEYQAYVNNNPYYYATKYGGFTVPTGFSPYATTNSATTITKTMWHTGSDSDKQGNNFRPDNYYNAGQANLMVAGLQSAFSSISALISKASTAFSTTSAQVNNSSNTVSYAADYDPKTWSGEVIASNLTFDSSGNPSAVQVWDARDKLQAMSLTSRKIVTCCTSAGAGLPFQNTNLSAGGLSSRTNYSTFANVTGVASGSQSAANFLAYLRGDQTKEAIQTNGVYRVRTYLLGDIVNSKSVPYGPPIAPYTDDYNPGYASFKSTYAARKVMVYVGANDGMMHAIDGTVATTGTTNGQELFAYIPSFVYGTNSTGPAVGLASLGNVNFTHHYLVDGTPNAFDLDMKNTVGSTATTNDWRSVIIGGLGKGGQGYYSIDVTDPSSWADETTVAGKVLWEFTTTHMGNSYGDASLVKTAKYGWVAILTSGYNNDDGVGYFFFVNPRTGALLETVSTGSGSTSAPAGLTYASAFINNFFDGTADSIYAGDLQGNMWRLDLTATSGNYPAPTKIAIASTDAAGTSPQPITTRPLIEIDPVTKKRYVFFGTGRLLADSDISSSQKQTFYAVIDGNSTTFSTSSTLPSGVTFPIVRSNLTADTSTTTGIGSTPANPMGWYIDLNVAANNVAERVNINPTSNFGVVAFAANLPNGDACNPSGTNRVFAVNFTTGKSTLVDSNNATIAYSTSVPGTITDLQFFNTNNGVRLEAGNDQKQIGNVNGTFNSSGVVKFLNWRELPTAD